MATLAIRYACIAMTSVLMFGGSIVEGGLASPVSDPSVVPPGALKDAEGSVLTRQSAGPGAIFDGALLNDRIVMSPVTSTSGSEMVNLESPFHDAADSYMIDGFSGLSGERYPLQLDFDPGDADSLGSSFERQSQDVSLIPSAVLPLPPAAWTGLLMLGVVMVRYRSLRR